MSFQFLDLPPELRFMVYETLVEDVGPHMPCLLASCRTIYNEIQFYVQRFWNFGANNIVIKPSFPRTLNSVSGPKGSRRARKTGGYSHWDIRALSSLTINLEYDGIIDDPFLRSLNLENEEIQNRDPPHTLQELDDKIQGMTRQKSRNLRHELGDVYRALKGKNTPTEVTLKIEVSRWGSITAGFLADFTTRGHFRHGIYKLLRPYITLPPRCELTAVPITHDRYQSDYERDQQRKHADTVAECFNKRRARWLSSQEFRTRQLDYLWDVRTLFGEPPAAEAPPVMENPSIQCRVCGKLFPSNNKLHQHLRELTNYPYTETQDTEGYYEYYYGCSREEVYRHWYDGYYRQPYPLHVRRDKEGNQVLGNLALLGGGFWDAVLPVGADGW
ncbi:hypothetical protein FQN54_003540 [Arachnomyces sp. PD_36]|nr:hypothetical protein FQN54_003540 [Arachnomyces sp. PD_36]